MSGSRPKTWSRLEPLFRAHAFRVGLVVGLILCISCLSLSEFHVYIRSQSLRDEARMEIAALARSFPLSEIEGWLRAPSRTQQDEVSGRLVSRLSALRVANPSWRLASLVGLDGSEFRFLTDSREAQQRGEAEHPPMYSAPVPLSDITAATKPFVAGPYGDRWGRWFAVFGPVLDADGDLLAVVGVDISADEIDSGHVFARVVGGSTSVAFLVLALLFGGWVARFRLLRQDYDELAEETERRSSDGSALRISQTELDGMVQERNRALSEINESLFKELEERQKSEDRLKENTAWFQQAAANISDVIWTMDMSFRITYVSPSVERLRGITIEEALVEHLEDMVTSDSLVTALEVFNEEITFDVDVVEPGERTRTMELEQRCKDGSTKWTEVRATVLRDENGVPNQILGVTRDISQRKKAEQEREELRDHLQHAQKMEAVGQLAGGVAHDFNNLLTSITGNLSLALLDVDPEHSLYELLDDAAEAAKRAAGLTRQLLAFSRKDAIERKIVNLNSVVRGVDKMIRRLVDEEVVLTTVLSEDLARILADPGQMELVVVNLVVNARDALDEEPRQIFIETRNVVLDKPKRVYHEILEPGEYVVLAVTDSGATLSQEERERVFEPFFSPKGRPTGFGLGLAVVFGIVRRHGGAIEVETSIGPGTTLALYFPKDQDEGQVSCAPPTLEAVMSGVETVLFAEDEPTVRAMTSRLLSRLGYNVVSAENGVDALAKLDGLGRPIDLLLTDVIMPEMNGVQLARNVVERQPDVKILFTSGYSGDVLGHHGVVTEEVNYLGKPYSPQELVKKIREVLDAE